MPVRIYLCIYVWVLRMYVSKYVCVLVSFSVCICVRVCLYIVYQCIQIGMCNNTRRVNSICLPPLLLPMNPTDISTLLVATTSHIYRIKVLQFFLYPTIFLATYALVDPLRSRVKSSILFLFL